MPRPLRPIADGLAYHVINRGNGRQSVFFRDGHKTCGHVWQGRFKSPVVQDDEHLLCVLRYIEANPLRADMVATAGEYRWSSFAAHGQGKANDLLDPVPAHEALAAYPAVRCRRWSAYVHQTPPEAEVQSIRRSSETGLPYGDPSWVKRLAKRLKLDLTIRPRGRPKNTAKQPKKEINSDPFFLLFPK